MFSIKMCAEFVAEFAKKQQKCLLFIYYAIFVSGSYRKKEKELGADCRIGILVQFLSCHTELAKFTEF